MIKTVVRRNWTVHGGVVDKEVQMMVTPKVVEEVRKHFNCSYLEGAELEDQGEDGTALTHWEKRIFEVHYPTYFTYILGVPCLNKFSNKPTKHLNSY